MGGTRNKRQPSMSLSLKYMWGDDNNKSSVIKYLTYSILPFLELSEWAVHLMDDDMESDKKKLTFKGAPKNKKLADCSAKTVMYVWDERDIVNSHYIGRIQQYANRGDVKKNRNVIVLLVSTIPAENLDYSLSDMVPKARFLLFNKTVDESFVESVLEMDFASHLEPIDVTFAETLRGMIFTSPLKRKQNMQWRYERAIKRRYSPVTRPHKLLDKRTFDGKAQRRVAEEFKKLLGRPSQRENTGSNIIKIQSQETGLGSSGEESKANELSVLMEKIYEEVHQTKDGVTKIHEDVSQTKDGVDGVMRILEQMEKSKHPQPPADEPECAINVAVPNNGMRWLLLQIHGRIRVHTRWFLRLLVEDDNVIEQVERRYDAPRKKELSEEVIYKCLCYWAVTSTHMGMTVPQLKEEINVALEKTGNPRLDVPVMQPRLKHALNSMRHFLTGELSDPEGVCIYLQSMGDIAEAHKNQVMQCSSLRRSRVDTMIDILVTRGDDAYYNMLTFLREDEGQQHIAQALVECEMAAGSQEDVHFMIDPIKEFEFVEDWFNMDEIEPITDSFPTIGPQKRSSAKSSCFLDESGEGHVSFFRRAIDGPRRSLRRYFTM